MPKAKERDGVYYRKDRGTWWVSYKDAKGQRQREAVAAHTRPQAVAARAGLMMKAERDRVLGVKEASDITTADLLARYKRHQKARLRPTGMRRGELLGLRWTDVDMGGRRVYLRETKNGSLRVLALNGLAMTVLTSLPVGGPGDPVLPDVNAQNLSVATKRLFAGLGIEGASFHSLRHTAASWLVMQGVDLYAVGQLLGHRTPRMTQRYAHLSPQYMAGAVGKLDSVFGEVMPDPCGGPHYVTIASPDFQAGKLNDAKLLI